MAKKLLLFCLFFFFSVRLVSAQTTICNTYTIFPIGGTSGTTFQISGNGCGGLQKSLSFSVLRDPGPDVGGLGSAQTVGGRFSVNIQVNGTPGIYRVYVYDGNTTQLIPDQITITGPSPTPTPKFLNVPTIAPSATPNPAFMSCNWALQPLPNGNKAIQVCFSGANEAQVRQHFVRVWCTKNCENDGIGFLRSILNTGLPYQDLPVGQVSSGTPASTCTGGELDKSVFDANFHSQKLTEAGCNLDNKGISVGFTNGSLSVNLVNLTPQQKTCAETAFAKNFPTLHGEVIQGSTSVCNAGDFVFSINAQTGTVAVVSGGPNGPSAGTEIGNVPSGPIFKIRPCNTTPVMSGGLIVGQTGSGVQTALGCLPTEPGPLIAFFLRIAIGIAGGIAFLLIILGGLRILTSTGNPEAMNEGKEIVSSAIVGLLLIIFSVFLLKVVGVDILGIPGFT